MSDISDAQRRNREHSIFLLIQRPEWQMLKDELLQRILTKARIQAHTSEDESLERRSGATGALVELYDWLAGLERGSIPNEED